MGMAGVEPEGAAWKKYQNSVPTDDYALLTDDGRFVHLDELGRGRGFDVLLTTNGFDHALLGAPARRTPAIAPFLAPNP